MEINTIKEQIDDNEISSEKDRDYHNGFILGHLNGKLYILEQILDDINSGIISDA